MEIRDAEDRYVQRVYCQIIALALFAHISYILIFAWLRAPMLAAYNVASAFFYYAMQKAVKRGYYRLAVSCIHVEVSVFASVCTLAAGWGTGTALYLMAMTSLVYFCPFKHKYVPYFFAVMEIVVFLALRLYTGLLRPGFLMVSERTALWLYIYNVCACFTIVLFAAFSSRVSAAVGFQELRDENKSLSALVNYDQLTGLLSRRAFLDRLEKISGGVTAMALSDIDDFKKINDTYGHVCGDRVLSESAELIRNFLGRRVDVCRWGGEEYVYLFKDQPFQEAVDRIRELRAAVEEHTFFFEGISLHITMTFGICSNEEGLSHMELVDLADKRMYEGKMTGKNKVIWVSGSEKGRTDYG